MTVQVTDAGTVSSNGEYEENGTNDRQPQYIDPNSGNILQYKSAWERWYILDMTEEGYTYKTVVTDGTISPWELEWLVHFGSEPAPTVTA